VTLITRRRLLYASAASAAAGASVGLYTWLVEPHWLEVVRRPLPIRGLPETLRGRTLAQLSDLHVGPRVADSYIADTFNRVSALGPDIVVYTGDFTSYDTDVYTHAARVYADAPRGRLATFGIRMLRNEVAEIGGLQIAGMDELWAHRFDPVRTLAALERDRPGWEGYHGWVLSGHTHGGQCKPPFLPPPLLPVENRRYTSGVFDLSGDRMLYISRGIGHLLQVRINVRPEVTLFGLQSA